MQRKFIKQRVGLGDWTRELHAREADDYYMCTGWEESEAESEKMGQMDEWCPVFFFLKNYFILNRIDIWKNTYKYFTYT